MKLPLLRGSTFLKYFLSYIVVLALSFAGLYYIVNFQLKHEYQKIYGKEYETKLSNLSQMITQSFMDIQNSNYLIENDIIFINTRYTQSDYLRYIAVTELKKYATSNTLAQDILYIDKKNNDVISANSSCFYQDGHVFIKSPEGDINVPNELIYSDDYNNAIYLQKSPGRMFYFFTCPNNSDNYRIIYILSESRLRSLINMYTAPEVTAVGLISNDKIILSTNNTEIAAAIGEARKAGSEPVPISGSTELYMRNTGLPDLTIAVCIDKSFLRGYINTVFRNSYLMMAAFAILGVILVFFLMKITYYPLHRLMRRITNKTGYMGNDIKALSHAFDESLEEKDALIEKISYYKRMINKTVLLAQSELNEPADSYSEKKIDTLFSEDFNGLIFVVKLIFSPDTDNAAVADFAETWLVQGSILIILESGPGQLSLLISLPDSSDENDHAVARFFCAMREKHPCKIAYSHYSANPMNIARLYDEASLAQKFLDQKDMVGYGSIDDFAENGLIPPYPYKVFDELSAHLEKLSFDKARETIDNLFQMIDMENSSMLFIRCIFIDALTLLSASINANHIKFDSYSLLFSETLYLCRNSQYNETKNEIRENMQAILAIFSAEISGAGIHTPHIIQFVEENSLSSDFSLIYLADHFHVSDAYMSLFFKKKFNVTLSDYVWNIRFEKAKVLLETTDDSIDQISEAVGYDNPSSFRRKFKQEAGISPSEYKKRASMSKIM